MMPPHLLLKRRDCGSEEHPLNQPQPTNTPNVPPDTNTHPCHSSTPLFCGFSLNTAYIFVYYFPANRINRAKRDKCLGNLKRDWTLSSYILQTRRIKLLPCILTLQFIRCPEFNFCRRYLPSDSHINTVICTRYAYKSRWRRSFLQILRKLGLLKSLLVKLSCLHSTQLLLRSILLLVTLEFFWRRWAFWALIRGRAFNRINPVAFLHLYFLISFLEYKKQFFRRACFGPWKKKKLSNCFFPSIFVCIFLQTKKNIYTSVNISGDARVTKLLWILFEPMKHSMLSFAKLKIKYKFWKKRYKCQLSVQICQ